MDSATAADFGVAARKSPAWLGVFAVVFVAAMIGFLTRPAAPAVFTDDDYDYIYDLKHLSFSTFVFKSSAGAQFVPFFKVIYGAGLLAANFDNVPLQWAALFLRFGMIGAFLVLMRRLNILSVGGALLCATAALASVGVKGVFFSPLNLCIELALCAIPVALLILTARQGPPSMPSVIAAAAVLAAGAMSFGMGFAPPFAIAGAYTLVAAQQRELRRYLAMIAAFWMIAVGLVALYFFSASHAFVDRPMSEAGSHPGDVGRFFLYGAVVNGALSGLFPEVFRGVVHFVFFLLLVAWTIWLLFTDERAGVKIVAITLLLSQMGIGALLALTKWSRGIQYATSFRYIYPNVVLELALLGVLVGVFVRRRCGLDLSVLRCASARSAAAVGCAVFVAASVGAMQARSEHLRFEAERQRCLDRIVTLRPAQDCIPTLYYAKDANFVRRVSGELRRK